jgi:hypothetical protein
MSTPANGVIPTPSLSVKSFRRVDIVEHLFGDLARYRLLFVSARPLMEMMKGKYER